MQALEYERSLRSPIITVNGTCKTFPGVHSVLKPALLVFITISFVIRNGCVASHAFHYINILRFETQPPVHILYAHVSSKQIRTLAGKVERTFFFVGHFRCDNKVISSFKQLRVWASDPRHSTAMPVSWLWMLWKWNSSWIVFFLFLFCGINFEITIRILMHQPAANVLLSEKNRFASMTKRMNWNDCPSPVTSIITQRSDLNHQRLRTSSISIHQIERQKIILACFLSNYIEINLEKFIIK